MIYVITTHPTDEWFLVQDYYFQKNIGVRGCKFFATWPEGSLGEPLSEKDDSLYHLFADREDSDDWSGNHIRNLNFLTHKVMSEAHDSDILLVFDGDAWPIAPLRPKLEKWFPPADYNPLVSIEFSGRRFPQRKTLNCAFIAMRVRMWRDYERERNTMWGAGGSGHGGCWDTNGALTAYLKDHKMWWVSLPRSNRVEPFYPLFGCYDQVIYHHGQGFYPVRTRRCEDRVFNDAELGSAIDHKGLAWHKMREFILRDWNFFEGLT